MKGEEIMNYEILTEGTGLMSCVYDATSGVGRMPDERQIFRDILKKRNVDYYVCGKCVYLITTDKYDILFKDLTLLKRVKTKIYFKTIEGELIPVTRQNFSIRCYFKEPQCPDAWVQEYIRRPKHHTT